MSQTKTVPSVTRVTLIPPMAFSALVFYFVPPPVLYSALIQTDGPASYNGLPVLEGEGVALFSRNDPRLNIYVDGETGEGYLDIPSELDDATKYRVDPDTGELLYDAS